MITTVFLTFVAIVGVAAALCYIPIRRAASKAYAELIAAEGIAVKPAREKYWALDRNQKTTALVVLTAYAFEMLAGLLLRVGHSSLIAGHPVLFWCGISLSGGILTVALTAMFFNDRDSDLRMKREAERRSKS